MDMPAESKKQQAYRKAANQFARAEERETNFRAEQAKAKAADDAKTARLRALRLAKEAADREIAAAETAARGPDKPATGKAAPAKRKVQKITVS